ncbi:MAG: hypothetical protein ACFFA6_10110 [Promethearchaeota archaeon]
MASYRLVIGIIVGITLSFFTVFFFNMTDIIEQIKLYVGSDTIQAAALIIGANFNFDMITFFTDTPTVLGFFAPELLAWIFIAFISGAISKGLKRGIITGLLIVVVDLLIWILLSIISGEDLMALFQGNQLIETLGGIFSAILGAFIGGLLGGLVSGPYEEFY